CRFECEDDPGKTDNTKVVHAYRIAQEAVANALKHGKAKTVTINLLRRGEIFVLKIINDETGFPEIPGGNRGMGLNIMVYRARVLGGSLNIRPGEKSGTVVEAVFPA